MSSGNSFLSGYLHLDRNLHSKFHVSSSSSFGSAKIVSQSVSQYLLLYMYRLFYFRNEKQKCFCLLYIILQWLIMKGTQEHIILQWLIMKGTQEHIILQWLIMKGTQEHLYFLQRFCINMWTYSTNPDKLIIWASINLDHQIIQSSLLSHLH